MRKPLSDIKKIDAINAASDFAASCYEKVHNGVDVYMRERNGRPSGLKALLRDYPQLQTRLINVTFCEVFSAILNDATLTTTALRISRAVIDKYRINIQKREKLVIGVQIIDLVGVLSGAWEIVAEQVDRPNKTDDGIKVVLGYKIKATGNVMEGLVLAGKCAVPGPVVNGVSERSRNVEKGKHALIHGNETLLAEYDKQQAPRFFEAINAMIGYRYIINELALHLINVHDQKKAQELLYEQFISKGMDEGKARVKSIEKSLI